MRVLIVGAGSIAQRHARCLRRIESDCEIVVWRWHATDNKESRAEVGDIGRSVYSAKDAIAAAPDFAIVANPATGHIAAAMELAARHIPLLIEKPISDRCDDIDRLRRLCSANNVPVAIGYVLRFHPLLRAVASILRAKCLGRVLAAQFDVGQDLRSWRPGRDWRDSVSAKRALGGGALLELSHEIDLACWLLGQPVGVTARIAPSSLPSIDVEDMADLILDLPDGLLINIHLDMVRSPPQRSLRLIGVDGTLEADLVTGRARYWASAEDRWQDLPSALAEGDDIYVDQLDHFIACIAKGTPMEVTIDDGELVVRIVEAARRSAAEGRMVAL